MRILALRTDKPEAEIGVYDDDQCLAYESWPAHRELSDTIHKKLNEILNKSSISLEQVQGIVIFEGPGSFTGLRIGFSVANALAYSLDIPIVASGGTNWLKLGVKELRVGKGAKTAMPKYGSEPNVTKPRK